MERNYTTLCVRSTYATSSGIWVGNNPTEYSFPLFIAQISIIFAATRITHALLAPLGQPQVVSHLIAGLILGPSFLGRGERFLAGFFPARSWLYLNLLSSLAYVLFTFVIGVKTDLCIIRRSGKKSLVIGWSAYFFSFVIGIFFAMSFEGQLVESMSDGVEILPTLMLWSSMSHPVIACLLTEHNLLTSKLGRLALSTSLTIDFQNMVIRVLANIASTSFSETVVLMSFGVSVLFFASVFLVAKPVVMWMVRMTPEGGAMGEGPLVAVIMIVLWCGLLGELIGLNVAVGAVMLGLILPGGPPLGRSLVVRLDRLVSGLFLPVFTAIAGIKMDLGQLADAKKCSNTSATLVACAVAKVGGVVVAGWWFRMPFSDAFALGLMLNSHGIVEIYTFMMWKDDKSLAGPAYTISVLLLIIITAFTSSLLKLVYNPTSQFASYSRLSVEQTGHIEELRVLACAHDEHDAHPIITILESSLPNPTCVYLLHLIPLVGRTNTVLAPYKCKKNKKKAPSITDHIVNAFRSLEHNHPGRLSFLPFVAISPYTSMHNDICQIAIDKKIALIILPFHKRDRDARLAKSFNPSSVRALNVNVLLYAPCSVAIFIDRGLSHGDRLSHCVAVYFLGGADDREALAYATSMADNNAVNLTLIRLVPPKDQRQEGREEALDNEAVNEFRRMNAKNRRVDYRQVEVRDGSDMTEAIRAMREFFGLLIVGKRDGAKSALTAGLEMWSEYPELGIIGDLLASTDLGGNASALVVQQQSTDRKGQSQRNEILLCEDDKSRHGSCKSKSDL